jgi:hypothetical protein
MAEERKGNPLLGTRRPGHFFGVKVHPSCQGRMAVGCVEGPGQERCHQMPLLEYN